MSESDKDRIVRETGEILNEKRAGYSESGAGGMLLALGLVAAFILWSRKR